MPTRLTLARYAFPGLIKSAERFKLRVLAIVLLLLFGLVLTCVMSWHITGGNVLLQRLGALKVQQAAIIKSISEAELKVAANGPVQFCAMTDEAGQAHYRNTEEYQLCARRSVVDTQMRAVRMNLRLLAGAVES